MPEEYSLYFPHRFSSQCFQDIGWSIVFWSILRLNGITHFTNICFFLCWIGQLFTSKYIQLCWLELKEMLTTNHICIFLLCTYFKENCALLPMSCLICSHSATQEVISQTQAPLKLVLMSNWLKQRGVQNSGIIVIYTHKFILMPAVSMARTKVFRELGFQCPTHPRNNPLNEGRIPSFGIFWIINPSLLSSHFTFHICKRQKIDCLFYQ